MYFLQFYTSIRIPCVLIEYSRKHEVPFVRDLSLCLQETLEINFIYHLCKIIKPKVLTESPGCSSVGMLGD